MILHASIHAPAGGATAARGPRPAIYNNFNPRSPRGERPARVAALEQAAVFQPALPARGATRISLRIFVVLRVFQPALPARGATVFCMTLEAYLHISTRAPREGSDHRVKRRFFYFNISTRAPRKGSDAGLVAFEDVGRISTHAPRKGSDVYPEHFASPRRISTHAPRKGSDAGKHHKGTNPQRYFNPRSPQGERL